MRVSTPGNTSEPILYIIYKTSGQKQTPPKQGFHGNEPCRDRTCDHRIKSPVLYQLS